MTRPVAGWADYKHYDKAFDLQWWERVLIFGQIIVEKLLAVSLVVASEVYTAWVASWLWLWLVVSVSHAPVLTTVQMLGLRFFVRPVTYRIPFKDDTQAKKHHFKDWGGSIEYHANVFGSGAVMLLVGWALSHVVKLRLY